MKMLKQITFYICVLGLFISTANASERIPVSYTHLDVYKRQDKHHGALSGILLTGICGGAIMPLIIGWIGDMTSLKTGMYFIFILLGYIFSIGFWAKPLIQNDVISFNKKDNTN